MKISTSSIKQSASKAIENKYVLYIVLFLAVTNILGYMMMGDIRVLAFFALVGFVTSKFSKNMIVILSVSMISTNFFLTGQVTSNVVEGMATGGDNETGQDQDNETDQDKDNGKGKGKGKGKDNGKDQTGMSNMNNKGAVADGAKKVNSNERIDYATTVEQAYDNLENIIGKGGIGKLTDDTSRLMDKQNKMFENLRGMGPLISQYKEMMGSMNLESINQLASSLIGGK